MIKTILNFWWWYLPCGVDTSGSAYSDGIKVLSSFAHDAQHTTTDPAEG